MSFGLPRMHPVSDLPRLAGGREDRALVRSQHLD